MADGKRPGGLTALAVLNFVFGGLSIIYTLVAGLVVVTAHTVVNTSMEAAERMGAKGEDLHNASSSAKGSVGLGYAYVALCIVGAALLIVAGVGYLKQKRMMGRTLGSVYALVSLASTLMAMVSFGANTGISLVFFVYPILTLIMVNTTFKDDLVN